MEVPDTTPATGKDRDVESQPLPKKEGGLFPLLNLASFSDMFRKDPF